MSARTWRLLPAVYASLEDIGEWTQARFGARQADIYLDVLIARCAAIAEGTVQGRNCRMILGADVPEDLHFAQAGQHFVVFVETADEIVVIAFLHQRSDLPKWVAKLAMR